MITGASATSITASGLMANATSGATGYVGHTICLPSYDFDNNYLTPVTRVVTGHVGNVLSLDSPLDSSAINIVGMPAAVMRDYEYAIEIGGHTASLDMRNRTHAFGTFVIDAVHGLIFDPADPAKALWCYTDQPGCPLVFLP